MKVSEFIAIVNGLRQQANDLDDLENVTAEDRKLLNKYKDAINDFAAFIDGCKDSNNSFDAQHFQTVLDHFSKIRSSLTNIDKIASANMIADASNNIGLIEQNCASFDVTKGMTLRQCIDNTAIKNVAINSEAQKIGATSSLRKMLVVTNANGDEVQGFFTEDRKLFDYGPAQQIKAIVANAVKNNPKNSAIVRWASTLNTEYGIAKLASCMLDSPSLNNITADNYDLNKGYNVPKLRIAGFVINDLDLRNLNDDPAFKQFAIAIRKCVDRSTDEYKTLCNEYVQYSDNHSSGGIVAKSGSSVAGRSIAMSNIANLLGMPNIVAKAVPMAINDNGKEISGVFMEKAVGNDLGNETKETLEILGEMPHNAFDGNGLKQLADLQILDYLCQNVDRHSENLLYSLDDNYRLIGVQGIDNDLSFGTIAPIHHKAPQHGTPLYCINVISQATADNIRKLQPETLKSALTGIGLDEQEITAACRRLSLLKTYLERNITNERVQFGSIKVLSDNEWAHYQLKTLAQASPTLKSQNIFTVADSITTRAQEFKRNVIVGNEKATKPETNPVNVAENFTKAQDIKPLSTQELLAIREKFENFKTRLISAENDNINANPSYVSLKKALDEFLENEHKKKMNIAESWHYQAQLIEIEKATEKYIQENLQISFVEIALQASIEVAKELCNFTDSYETVIREAILAQEEEELDKIADELKEEQAKFDLIIDTLAEQIQEGQPHLSKDEIKECIFNAPVIKAMMDTDEALEDYSKLAQTAPESLLNLYTSKMLMLGEDQFTDDMHKALVNKLMVANGLKNEAGEDIVPDKQPDGVKISENQNYKNLVGGLEAELGDLKKAADNLEDNQMKPELLAGYISKKLILAKVKTLGTKNQTKETLATLKKLANNAADKDGIFVDAIKSTPEINAVIKKFAHCDNVGGKIGNMYEVYLAEVAKRPKTREIDLAKQVVVKMLEKSTSYNKNVPLSNAEIESQAMVLMETDTYKTIKSECGDMIKYISPDEFYNKLQQKPSHNLENVEKENKEIANQVKELNIPVNPKLGK